MLKSGLPVKAFIALQLAFSLLLGVAVVWGYSGYRSALGPFTQSLATAITSTADVIAYTAETVQTKQSMVNNTLAMLVSSRKLIEELRASASVQAALAPKYAEGLRSASSLLGTAGNSFSTLGDSLMFSVPTGIDMKGPLPTIVTTRPLEGNAKNFKDVSAELKSLGASLLIASNTVTKDAQNLSSAIVETCSHAIKLLDDTEKTLSGLKGLEFTKAISDLKVASDNLRTVGAQLEISGTIGEVLLILGLLLSGWCFLNQSS